MSDDEMAAEVIREVGLFGLKALVTLCSGAIVVLLAFSGNSLGAGSIDIDMPMIRASMALFLAGIASALMSAMLTYLLAQFRRSDRVSAFSNFTFVLIMVVPAIFGFLFFGAGALTAIYAIDEMGEVHGSGIGVESSGSMELPAAARP